MTDTPIITVATFRRLASIVGANLPTGLTELEGKYLCKHAKKTGSAVEVALRGILPSRAQKPVSDLLTFVREDKLSAIGAFDPKDKIRVGEVDGVKISWVGKTLAGLLKDCQVEKDVPATTLMARQLKRNSVDGPIIAELGEELADTTFGQLWEQLKKQGHGQKGILLTNGWANARYIKINGVRWAVFSRWTSAFDGWYVEASSVTYPDARAAGIQVFSR